MLLWIIVLVIAAIALSFVVGGGINIEFIKILCAFIVGFCIVLAIKKLWDEFKK